MSLEELTPQDIDRIDTLSNHVAEILSKGHDLNELYEIHVERESRSICNFVVLHGVERTIGLLEALIVAIQETNSEKMHDSFLMALDLKESLGE